MRVHARATRGTDYRAPGGPWDVPSLDALVSGATPPDPTRAPEAVLDADVRLRPAELDTMVAAVAGGLRDLGVRRRDVVAWQLVDGTEALVLHRACWRLGAIAAPVPSSVDRDTATALLATVAPAVVVAAAALPLAHHPGAVLVGGAALPSRRARPPAATTPVAAAATPPFAKLLAASPEHHGPAQPTDVAVVLFVPRSGRWVGVVHTHRTLAAAGRHVVDHHRLGAADTVVAAAPLWHVDGLVHGLVAPALAGARTVLLPRWQPTVALELIERERVTVVAAPLRAAVALGAGHGAAHRLRAVRALAVTGAVATAAAPGELAVRSGTATTHWYGATEAPVTAIRPWWPDGTDDGWQASPSTEVRVVDPATGKDREPGALGEVWVRGPGLFGGYLDEASTKATIARGGWLRTGDLAGAGPGALPAEVLVVEHPES